MQNKGKTRTLRHRLLRYFVLVALLPALLIMLLYFGFTQHETRRQMENDTRSLLTHAMDKIENKAGQANELVSWILQNDDVNAILSRSGQAQYGEDDYRLMQSIRSQFYYRPISRYILSLFILGDNGADIRGGTEASLISPQQARALTVQTQGADEYWGQEIPNLTSLTEDSRVIYYRHPIYDRQSGEHLGELIILFSGTLFSEEFADLLVGTENKIVLYNRSGGMLLSIGAPPKDDALRFAADSLSTGWRLEQEASAAMLDAQRRTAAVSTVLLAVVVCAMMVSLAAFLSRNLAAPVERISRHVERISQGDFRHEPMPQEDGELGRLSREIQRMGDDIEGLLRQQEEKQRLELRMLQSQMNPHFLYNTLSSIKLMAAMQGKTGISSMIEALGKLLRANLAGSREIVTLAEELELLDSYLYIQNTRLKGKLRYETVVPEGLLCCETPKFILQPVVENAILHGLEGLPQGGTVRVIAERQDGTLRITVRDDGVGMAAGTLGKLRRALDRTADADTLERSHSIGLYNVQARLRLRYGQGYGVQIWSESGAGTAVCLSLPYRAQ